MKLSELRPCANCCGSIAPSFYVIDFSQGVLDGRALRETIGVSTILGGLHALPIAEALSPSPDVTLIFGDKDPSLRTRLLVCADCFLGGPIDLALLWEAHNQRREAQSDEESEARA